MKTLDFREIENVMVLRENRTTPADADWDAFLRSLAARRDSFDSLRIMVFTDGGGPSQAQRARLATALGGKPVRVAVVTESTTVRFIVSSIALLNSKIATFSPKEIAKAYAHCGLDPQDRRAVDLALKEMESTVG